MYEASARVPMIISGPGVRRGAVVQDLTSLLDLFPTLVAMQGGTPADDLAGFTLMPFLKADVGDVSRGAVTRNDFVTSQYHSNMGNTGSFMIRQGRWKYIAFGQNGRRFNGSCGHDCTYNPQLFDVLADPEELKDVAAAEPAAAAQLDQLLRSHVDYPAVDLQCKKYDKLVYSQFIGADPASAHKEWVSRYTGFDCGASNCGNDAGTAATGDWLKVEQWLADPL